MVRDSVGKIRRFIFVTLFLCLILLAPSPGALQQGVGASSGSSSLAPAKLDPGLYQLFLNLQPAERIIETNRGDIEQKGDRVKVVVNLQRPVGMSFVERGLAGLGDVRNTVDDVQDRVVSQLREEEFEVTMRLDIQYAVAGWVTQAGLRHLQSLPEVDSIVPDYVMYLQTTEGRALSRSDAAASLGATGSGVTVAVTDGGFDYWHTTLGGSTPKNGSCAGCSNPVVTYMIDVADGDNDVYFADSTTLYHGTGTSGIVRTYAPSAKLMLIKVAPNSSTSTATSNLAAGVDWAVANKNMDPSSPIEIISMSFGGGKYYTDCPSGTVQTAFDNAKAAGIIAFVSSGNSGYDNALGSPGCDPDVVGVGSVFDVDNATYAPFAPAYCWDSTRQANERICYSNASPALDIYAPSEDVVCPSYDSLFSGTPHSTMRSLGGTSSAAPAAAGAAAQILSARPSLKGDKNGLLALMQATGDEVINNPNPTYQNKRFNVENAANFAGTAPVVNSFTATPSTLTAGPMSMAPLAGASTLAWSCSNTATVTISGLSGTFSSSGSTSVSPSVTTLYTLTASGPGGTATSTATVTVTTGGGSMSITPDEYDFGSQTAGSTSTAASFSIQNTGSTSMVIGTIALTGTNPSEFVIQNDTASSTSIGPSGIRTFDVAFSPASAGAKGATVLIPTSVGSGSIAVEGNGVSGTGIDLTGSWNRVRRSGESVRGTCKVTNAGAVSSGGGFAVKFYLSKNPTHDAADSLVKTSTVSTLAAGASKRIKVNTTASSAYDYLIAVVDSGSAITESDESNNTVVSPSL